ncbi:MAG: sigma-70 family RNA polymerase sigma factor [Actinophytocola sp.]|uniref:RNA polymerase sigma factor n=1 Tax=Actinophytocola sp. TaxID=1872138 RepID=UPI0013264564|nr:sigma-70 family RNA polymerase sigma factor [Actinophytocola sp.]MPZ81347.1 sigma-70 family RNA polymerase sigma factor [Actinophytocola sp.]
MTEALEKMPDAALIAAVREGDPSAFGVLYERHLVSAKRAASCLAGTPAEREDLVAEAFTRVLRMLREGRGPDEEFRPYLLVTLRNTAIHTTTRRGPVALYADVPDVVPVSDADPVIDRWHANMAADAFASLPERWRVVLWHTEVEKESPATVAPMLGMRPNSVAALAYRAREGLRQAYLKLYLSAPARRECVPTVNKLAGWVRHNVPAPLTSKINRHLNTCSDCRARADALSKVNAELRGVLAPVVLGAPLAAAYLQAPAAVAAVSGAASAVSGAVASSAAAATGAGVSALTSALGLKTVALNVAAALAVAAVAVASTAASPAVPFDDAQTVAEHVPDGEAPLPDLRVGSATAGPSVEESRNGGSPDAVPGTATTAPAPATGTAADAGDTQATNSSTGNPTTDDTKAENKAAKAEAKTAAKAAKKAAEKQAKKSGTTEPAG